MSLSSIEQIALWLREANSAVVFTGAGISTESGIPDFRSPGGIWSQTQPVYYQDFLESAEARYEYWRQKAIAHQEFHTAEPNIGHQFLAEWEREGLLTGVITQNIDGLHQLAGSQNVLELHGTAREVECQNCQFRDDVNTYVEQFLANDAVPPCPACQGPRLKHATVSFGQSLPENVLFEAGLLAETADLFVVLGSSLVVQPAASLPELAAQTGANLVIINRDETPLDDRATVVIHDSIGNTLSQIADAMK